MLFKLRSQQKEYLDNTEIATGDLFRNLAELNLINKYLGGYNASISGLKSIFKFKKATKSLLDIGFGGGDSMRELAHYAENRKLKLFFYGVDMKADCMNYAEQNLSAMINKKLICDDYRNISGELLKEIDVIHCSLFLHHLSDKEIVDLLKFGKANNCILLINDLHRNWLAYYSIKFLTSIFSKSWLVKNDAPLSVLRGFTKKELVALIREAGFTDFSVRWSWAFRYIVIAVK